MVISAVVSTTASTTIPLMLTGMYQALSPRSCAPALTDGTTRRVIVIGCYGNSTRFLSLVFGGARGLGDGEQLSANLVRLGHSRLNCPGWLHEKHITGVFDFGEALVDEWLGLSRPAGPLSVDDGDFEHASVTFTFPLTGEGDLD